MAILVSGANIGEHLEKIGLRSKKEYLEQCKSGDLLGFEILVNRLRIKSRYLINQIIGVCAALWNFSLSLKP